MMIAVWILVGVVITRIYLLFTHQRHTPYLKLELDSLPALGEGIQMLAGVTDGSVHEGNSVTVLQNGDLFPAMQADIAAAQHTVHLETFVWTRGSLEKEFVQLFCRKAKEGVKTRVLIDAIGGSSADSKCFEQLTRTGVELAQYCRPRWVNLRRFNQRTHRKLLIVDGKIGYVFGHGIADQWIGNAEDDKHWSDKAGRV